jgi:hypothetical protein
MESQGSTVEAAPAQEPTIQTDFTVSAGIDQRSGELAFGGVLGLLGLLWLYPEPQFAVYQWFFLPFCTLGSLNFVLRAFDPRPRLTVDAEGITDRWALLLGSMRLGWDEVVDVTSRKLHGGLLQASGDTSREVEGGTDPGKGAPYQALSDG